MLIRNCKHRLLMLGLVAAPIFSGIACTTMTGMTTGVMSHNSCK